MSVDKMNINFEENVREITLNGDENRKIKFSPSDYAIVERFNTAQEHFKTISKEMSDIKISEDNSLEDMSNLIKIGNEKLKAEVDYIFGYPISNVVFENQSPLTFIKGRTLFEIFIESAMKYVVETIKEEQEKSKEKVSKYTKRYHK